MARPRTVPELKETLARLQKETDSLEAKMKTNRGVMADLKRHIRDSPIHVHLRLFCGDIHRVPRRASETGKQFMDVMNTKVFDEPCSRRHRNRQKRPSTK